MGQVFIRMGKVASTLLLLTVLLFSGLAVWSQDTATVEEGRGIFVEKRCYTCHTVNADAEAIEKEKVEFAKAKGVAVKEGDEEEEEKRGGDLSHVGKVRDVNWIKELVQNPKDQFKDTSECSREAKKKYRKRFKGTDEELEALVTYLSSLKYEEQQAKDFETCLKE